MRKDLLSEVIALRNCAWNEQDATTDLGLAGTCLREFVSFRLNASAASDRLIGFRMLARCRARWRKSPTFPSAVHAEGNVILLDGNAKAAGRVVPYIERMTGQRVWHVASRDDIPGSLVEASGLPLRWWRFALATAVMCLWKPDRIHRALGIASVAELAEILALVEKRPGVQVVDFAPYLIDSNLLYLLLKKRGVRTLKVPSSGPLKTHNHLLLADTLAISTPYQEDELNQLREGIRVTNIEKWLPERALEYMNKYATPSAPEPEKHTVGFYSHGSWVRRAEDHASDGLGIHEQENRLLQTLASFVNSNPDWTLVVFPHPREKAAKMRAKTRDYYGKYLPLDRIDLRLDSTANNQQFEAADVGVAVFSTIVYERLFCGYKTRILNLTNPAFPLAGSSLGRICVRSEAALEGAIYECAGRTRSEDFRQLGITAFRWDSFPQIGAK